MKKLLVAMILITIFSSCKEKKFRESHRFQWGAGETCYYVDQQTGDTVMVAMKYCHCNGR